MSILITRAVVLLAITLEVSLAEFVAIQRLSDAERRARFDLPAWCDPVVSGLRGRGTTIEVVVDCALDANPGAVIGRSGYGEADGTRRRLP